MLLIYMPKSQNIYMKKVPAIVVKNLHFAPKKVLQDQRPNDTGLQ